MNEDGEPARLGLESLSPQCTGISFQDNPASTQQHSESSTLSLYSKMAPWYTLPVRLHADLDSQRAYV